MIVYVFDLKAKNKKMFNRIKRRFYYNLNKSKIANSPKKTKSVIIVQEGLEKEADLFFKGFEGEIIVYKIKTTEIAQLL